MANNEKANLYRQIVTEADLATILERMQLHGFWPKDLGLPVDPQEEAAERQRIQNELRQLRDTYSVSKNWKKLLSDERKRRWQESKQRRAKAKEERLLRLQQRREEWEAFKSSTIVHAGVGVSAGLQHVQSDVEALSGRELPVMHSGADVAERLGMKLRALRWLTYHRRGATVVHYHRFSIAKKSGGVRFISAPKPALAHAQRWILENVLERLEVDSHAHGFVRARSIVSNATPHVGKEVVINLDLKNFFPSITFRRVQGLFRSLGYSDHVATVLGLLCTEPPRVGAEVDGKVYFVALGERVLPQGACTSPAITNALCRRLDRRLAGLARKHQFEYTRYADDLTFSGDEARVVGRLLKSTRSILEEEGFTEHPSKTRVMRRSRRQEVTGVTVNARPTISRKEYRQLKATLHNVAKNGLESQNREERPNFAGYLKGRVEFFCMVDPERATKLRSLLEQALGAE
ncbi:MAG: reverse transcriptase family protein [Gemmataceae bacterium]